MKKQICFIIVLEILLFSGISSIAQSNTNIISNSVGSSEPSSPDVYCYFSKPIPRFIYLRNIPVFPMIGCIVIGPIDVVIDAGCSEGEIEKVELIIDTEIVQTFTSPPYSWRWDRPEDSILHWIEARAYAGSSEAGNAFPLLKFL